MRGCSINWPRSRSSISACGLAKPRARPLPPASSQKRLESLAYAKGQYVAILDSDDIWIDGNKLTSQVEFLTNNPTCAVVGTNIDLIDKNGATMGTNTYLLDDRAIRSNILVRNQFAHSSVMMRKLVHVAFGVLKSGKPFDPALHGA